MFPFFFNVFLNMLLLLESVLNTNLTVIFAISHSANDVLGSGGCFLGFPSSLRRTSFFLFVWGMVLGFSSFRLCARACMCFMVAVVVRSVFNRKFNTLKANISNSNIRLMGVHFWFLLLAVPKGINKNFVTWLQQDKSSTSEFKCTLNT